MMKDKSSAGDQYGASLVRGADIGLRLAVPKFRYDFQHIRDGEVIDEWSQENVVTTEGAKDMLDKYFAGSAYTAAWYLGLISSASYTTPPAITNTAANLSGTGNGWAECSATYAPNYDTPAGTNRGVLTGQFSAATGTDPVSKTTSATIDITFSGTGTVKGAFIAAGATRLSTTAPLYSAALFSGDKSVVDNDILKVTVTVSLDI